jgi:aspartokinase
MEIIVQKYGGTSVIDENAREFIIRRAIAL